MLVIVDVLALEGTGVFVVLKIVVVSILVIVEVRVFLEVVIGVLLAPLKVVVIRAVLGLLPASFAAVVVLLLGIITVSYTHLTLPTKRIV